MLHTRRGSVDGKAVAVNCKTPSSWVWAYHATLRKFLSSIRTNGLRPAWHSHVEDAPVIFVEPDLDGVLPYHRPPETVVLRFKTPGFGNTEDGETVIYGGSERPNAYPDEPLVGERGEDGVIQPECIQILRGKSFEWLIT